MIYGPTLVSVGLTFLGYTESRVNRKITEKHSAAESQQCACHVGLNGKRSHIRVHDDEK